MEPTARRERWPKAALLGIGALAAAASYGIGRWLYPLGSINHDEPMYTFSARLLQRGNLTLPLSYESLRPWASGIRNGRIVLKYTPIWPSVLAVGGKLGSMRLGGAAAAAAAVILIGLLGRDLFGRWTEGLLAASFLLLSPIFLLQTGTYLPYVFQLALDLAIALALLGALRRWPAGCGAPRAVVFRLIAGGVLWGLALFARPYDALLLGIPIGCALLASTWRQYERLAKTAGWVALGAVIPIALLLAYNAQLMGAPLASTFSVTGPDDKLGFGTRGVFATSAFEFARGDALVSVRENLAQLPAWTFGGVLLVLLAAYGLWRHRRGGSAIWAIAGIAATFAVGYAVFWSPYSIVKLWPGSATMGPFYHLPILIPLALFGAAGLAALADRQRFIGLVVTVLLVAVTVVSASVRVDRNRTVTHEYEAAQRLVNEAHLGQAVLFMPDRGQNGYESAAPFLENQPSLRQPVIYAIDDGAKDFAVIDRFPDRTPARMRAEVRPGDDLLAPTRFVERLEVVRGATVTLHFRVANTVGTPTVVSTLDAGGISRSVVLDTASTKGATYVVTWTLHGGSAPVGTGSPGRAEQNDVVLPPSAGSLQVGAQFISPDRKSDQYRIQFPYEARGGVVRVLTPGVGQYLYQFGAPTWVNQAIAPTLAQISRPTLRSR